jgi:hypothetical protein
MGRPAWTSGRMHGTMRQSSTTRLTGVCKLGSSVGACASPLLAPHCSAFKAGIGKLMTGKSKSVLTAADPLTLAVKQGMVLTHRPSACFKPGPTANMLPCQAPPTNRCLQCPALRQKEARPAALLTHRLGAHPQTLEAGGRSPRQGEEGWVEGALDDRGRLYKVGDFFKQVTSAAVRHHTCACNEQNDWSFSAHV